MHTAKVQDNYMRRKYDDSSDEESEKFLNFGELKFARKTSVALKDLTKSPTKLKKNVQEKPALDIPPRNEKKPFVIEDKIEIPSAINQYLHHYQQNGVAFLWNCFKERKGCILADDMGLGKTIQVISLIATIKHSFPKESPIILVVSPTSVLYNWSDELDVWVNLRVGLFHRKSKDEVIEKAKRRKFDVILTTHETMRIYFDAISEIIWSIVVFDEVHRIKEDKSLLTQAAKRLPSLCRIGLTGTPLQNNLKELWCLLDWANPGCLGSSKGFEETFERPMTLGQRLDATKRELATARKKQQELALLHREWMLRRTKDKILDELPKKEEKIVFCPVSPLQKKIYEEILELPKCKMLLLLDKKCRCGSNKNGRKCCLKKFNWRKYLFPFIHMFLKLSNHTALIFSSSNKHPDDEKDKNELNKEIFKHLQKTVNGFKEISSNMSFANLTSFELCGKMHVLHKLLTSLLKNEEEDENNKILVFSHSTKLLSILEAYIVSRGILHRKIDGRTSPKERHLIMKDFNINPNVSVCLLSTLVGSLGMNFTGANIVIIFDPMWNPTYEQQAQDRAYRIGQRRNVSVYRLISVGTIEENIYMRQIYKQQLSNIAVEMSSEHRYFNGVAGDTKHRGELFGITNMFKFSADHNSSGFAQQVFGRTRQTQNGVITARYEPIVAENEKQQQQQQQQQPTQNKHLHGNVGDDYSAHASQCVDDIIDTEKEDVSADEEAEIKIDFDALFEDCDVSIAPSSRRLVGACQEEEKFSKRAIRDVFWKGRNSQDLANKEDTQESQDVGLSSSSLSKYPSHDATGGLPASARMRDMHIFERIGKIMFIIGSTPNQVIGKQFEEMARVNGMTTPEFADFILSESEGKSKEILRKYYLNKEPAVRLIPLFDKIYGSNKCVTLQTGEDEYTRIVTTTPEKQKREKSDIFSFYDDETNEFERISDSTSKQKRERRGFDKVSNFSLRGNIRCKPTRINATHTKWRCDFATPPAFNDRKRKPNSTILNLSTNEVNPVLRTPTYGNSTFLDLATSSFTTDEGLDMDMDDDVIIESCSMEEANFERECDDNVGCDIKSDRVTGIRHNNSLTISSPGKHLNLQKRTSRNAELQFIGKPPSSVKLMPSSPSKDKQQQKRDLFGQKKVKRSPPDKLDCGIDMKMRNWNLPSVKVKVENTIEVASDYREHCDVNNRTPSRNVVPETNSYSVLDELLDAFGSPTKINRPGSKFYNRECCVKEAEENDSFLFPVGNPKPESVSTDWGNFHSSSTTTKKLFPGKSILDDLLSIGKVKSESEKLGNYNERSAHEKPHPVKSVLDDLLDFGNISSPRKQERRNSTSASSSEGTGVIESPTKQRTSIFTVPSTTAGSILDELIG